MKNKVIAIIPAKGNSRAIKKKNIRKILGKPLIYYTIIQAKKSKLINDIVVSTDSRKYSHIAKKYGAEVPFLRPKNIATSQSSDYQWIKFTLDNLKKRGEFFSHFFILRPTSPFRTHQTILRAWKKFRKIKSSESLRAVEVCKQHPGKMWKTSGLFIKPFFSGKKFNQPYHNLQFKSLPKVLTQNASLEISKVEV